MAGSRGVRGTNESTRDLGRAVFAVPVVVSLVAIAYIAGTGQWDRVSSRWASSLTMAFGSFLAGSSPEGGGAVAFPIFTKVLHVEAPVARSFGLMIQAVGMTSASAFILARRRPIDRRSTLLGAAGGTAGLLISYVLLTDADHPFRSSVIPAEWVKVLFTILLATMSWIMVSALRQPGGPSTLPMVWNQRTTVGLLIAAVIGGGFSAMTGTGVNVLLFLFVVTLCGTRASVAVPSSILAMTVVSIVGFVMFGLVDGQLSIGFDAAGNVASVGGQAVAALDPDTFDLFALWLAAVPIVVWGAPIGSLVIAHVREERLVAFIAALAAVEVVTTLILVRQIREDLPLLVATMVGLCSIPFVVGWLSRSRFRLLGLEHAVEP